MAHARVHLTFNTLYINDYCLPAITLHPSPRIYCTPFIRARFYSLSYNKTPSYENCICFRRCPRFRCYFSLRSDHYFGHHWVRHYLRYHFGYYDIGHHVRYYAYYLRHHIRHHGYYRGYNIRYHGYHVRYHRHYLGYYYFGHNGYYGYHLGHDGHNVGQHFGLYYL